MFYIYTLFSQPTTNNFGLPTVNFGQNRNYVKQFEMKQQWLMECMGDKKCIVSIYST